MQIEFTKEEKELGIYYYNRGLTDAQDIFKSRVDSITDAIYELEVPTEFLGNYKSMTI